MGKGVGSQTTFPFRLFLWRVIEIFLCRVIEIYQCRFVIRTHHPHNHQWNISISPADISMSCHRNISMLLCDLIPTWKNRNCYSRWVEDFKILDVVLVEEVLVGEAIGKAEEMVNIIVNRMAMVPKRKRSFILWLVETFHTVPFKILF